MHQLVCSDFHLNITNRLDDFKNSMDQISDYAIKNKVNRLMFLGDAFHRRRPHPLEQRTLEKWVMKLVDYNIEVICLLGNHDTTAETNTVEYFNILKTKNVRVVKPPLVLDNIYYDHILLKESKMGPLSYKIETKGLSVKGLVNRYPKVKAFILGHVHKPQIINKKPLIMHVGSIERVDFGERNEDKYFLDINSGKLKMIKLNIRPMVQCDVDLKDNPNCKILPRKYNKKPIVKIVLNGTKQQIDYALPLAEEYRKECYSLKIIKKVKRNQSRGQKTKISEERTIVQNFNEYSKLKQLPEKVIKEGQKLINEYN